MTKTISGICLVGPKKLEISAEVKEMIFDYLCSIKKSYEAGLFDSDSHLEMFSMYGCEEHTAKNISLSSMETLKKVPEFIEDIWNDDGSGMFGSRYYGEIENLKKIVYYAEMNDGDWLDLYEHHLLVLVQETKIGKILGID